MKNKTNNVHLNSMRDAELRLKQRRRQNLANNLFGAALLAVLIVLVSIAFGEAISYLFAS